LLIYPDLPRILPQRCKIRITELRMSAASFLNAQGFGLLTSDLLGVFAQHRKIGIIELKMGVGEFRPLGIGAGQLCEPEQAYKRQNN
jgi:hypothetical protein